MDAAGLATCTSTAAGVNTAGLAIYTAAGVDTAGLATCAAVGVEH